MHPKKGESHFRIYALSASQKFTNFTESFQFYQLKPEVCIQKSFRRASQAAADGGGGFSTRCLWKVRLSFEKTSLAWRSTKYETLKIGAYTKVHFISLFLSAKHLLSFELLKGLQCGTVKGIVAFTSKGLGCTLLLQIG